MVGVWEGKPWWRHHIEGDGWRRRRRTISAETTSPETATLVWCFPSTWLKGKERDIVFDFFMQNSALLLISKAQTLIVTHNQVERGSPRGNNRKLIVKLFYRRSARRRKWMRVRMRWPPYLSVNKNTRSRRVVGRRRRRGGGVSLLSLSSVH